jgi:arylsulfatase
VRPSLAAALLVLWTVPAAADDPAPPPAREAAPPAAAAPALAPARTARRTARPPNVVVFLADDMGFSDLPDYGGEISTPALTRLAADGVRFSQFYATPRCSPTRAALLTGRYPHAAGVGWLADSPSDERAYRGAIRPDVPTLPELLDAAGYRSWIAGKWHLDPANDPAGPDAPLARGFARYFGVMRGADDQYHPDSLARDRERLPPPGDGFYLSDALSEQAAGWIREHGGDAPFFLYVAYTAPHWPVQAPAEDLERYAGRYRRGWDALRERRAQRLGRLDVLRASWELSPRDAKVPAWQDEEHPGWQRARMRAYAAMVERMDRGVGRVLDALDAAGLADDTLVAFLSDNGASPEGLSPASGLLRRAVGFWTPQHYGDDPARTPGGPNTFMSYGRGWSNLSNTPFRGHKAGLLEGGIASPLIVRWPAGLARPAGSWVREPAHVVDLVPTILELAGVGSAAELDGESLAPLLAGGTRSRGPLFWEHEGWRAVRDGDLKLVARWPGLRGEPRWQLYDLAADRTELHDLAAERPADVTRLAALWEVWAQRAGVRPWPWVLPAARKAGLAALCLSILLLALLLWGGFAYARRVSSKRT